jgi:hypothetical protein
MRALAPTTRPAVCVGAGLGVAVGTRVGDRVGVFVGATARGVGVSVAASEVGMAVGVTRTWNPPQASEANTNIPLASMICQRKHLRCI